MSGYVLGAIGGAIIGLSATAMLLATGRVAGVSGFLSSIFPGESEARDLKLLFVAGLVVAGLALRFVYPAALPSASPSALVAIAAGLIVGFGTRLGGGCTSGHGVCGMARLSRRSVAATCIFMGAGVLTVLAMRLAGWP